jgi:hypothetical protein
VWGERHCRFVVVRCQPLTYDEITIAAPNRLAVDLLRDALFSILIFVGGALAEQDA